MRHLFTFASSAAVLALVATSHSFAADISAPAVPAVYDWTGFYIGANAGYHWGYDGGVTLEETDSLGGIGPGGDDSGILIDAGAREKTLGDELDGFIGGGQLGYNWQSSAWVLGAETDFQWANLDENGHSSYPGGVFNAIAIAPVDVDTSQSMDFFGTTRLRAGYAADNLLFYITGGLAYGNTDFDFDTNDNGHVSGGNTEFKFGWTVGGGLEYGMTDAWTLKAEYLYYDLGKSSDHASYDPPFGTFSEKDSAEFRGSIARVGVNFRF